MLVTVESTEYITVIAYLNDKLMKKVFQNTLICMKLIFLINCIFKQILEKSVPISAIIY